MLRNLYLVDVENPGCLKGDDAPLASTYGSIVGQSEQPFTIEDARFDPRLRDHLSRENVVSYCGVLLRDRDGKPFGVLCHFDLVPSAAPTDEIKLMEAAVPLLMTAYFLPGGLHTCRAD